MAAATEGRVGRQGRAEVRCHSGYTYAERPCSFVWEDRDYYVEKIEREWKEPGERRFVVLTEEAKRLKLCYYEEEDTWEVFPPETG